MSEPPIGPEEDAIEMSSAAAARMRAAREAAGMSLKDVADKTRVPLRHLTALEEGSFSALPGTTYCAGFARAYARAVGIDEDELVSQVREEIDDMGGLGHSAHEFEEAVNPASVPPRWLAWATALIVLALAAGYGLWRTQLNTPPTDEQIAAQQAVSGQEEEQGTAGLVRPAVEVPTGPVVMTAADTVWMRIYQADGTRIFEGTLQSGESFTLPDNARDPMILTGRPDALALTVGGQAVPPLGTAERTISDVPVSAAALLARGRTSATAADAVPREQAVSNQAIAAPIPAASPAATSPAVRTPAESSPASRTPENAVRSTPPSAPPLPDAGGNAATP